MKYREYYNEDGSPIKCMKCKCEKFEEKTTVYLDHNQAEADILCANCGDKVSYWAYGYYLTADLLSLDKS